MKVVEHFNYEDVTGIKFGSSLFGRPNLCSHVYFVDGLLIDTGHRNMRKEVAAHTKDLAVDQIFITHHHEDHSGNIQILKDQFECDVFGSSLCCEAMIDPPTKVSFAQKMAWGDRPPYKDLIPKDDNISTPRFTFQIVPIPGHAYDMVALYEPEQKWLFSADLYVHSYIAYFLDNESTLEQIHSIKRILELDFKVLLCSHNPQFENGKEKLKAKLNFLETFYDEVSALYLKGCSVKEIFKRLGLKENRWIYFISGGHLSKRNMVESVIRDVKGNASKRIKA